MRDSTFLAKGVWDISGKGLGDVSAVCWFRNGLPGVDGCLSGPAVLAYQ